MSPAGSIVSQEVPPEPLDAAEKRLLPGGPHRAGVWGTNCGYAVTGVWVPPFPQMRVVVTAAEDGLSRREAVQVVRHILDCCGRRLAVVVAGETLDPLSSELTADPFPVPHAMNVCSTEASGGCHVSEIDRAIRRGALARLPHVSDQFTDVVALHAALWSCLGIYMEDSVVRDTADNAVWADSPNAMNSLLDGYLLIAALAGEPAERQASWYELEGVIAPWKPKASWADLDAKLHGIRQTASARRLFRNL